MNKNKILSIILVIVVLIGLSIGSYYLFFYSDATKFKNEYEALNDTIRKDDGEKYNNVNIPKDNPIKYVHVAKAIKLLDSDKAIIYIGASWCPWCRNMLAPMFDVANNLNIDTIYYLNLDRDKSNYEVSEGELKQLNKGSKKYYELLDKLKDYLRDYNLTDNEGKIYSTGEKRIYMPFFITIKDGEIIDAKEISRTLEDGQNKYSEMTENQYNDLYNQFYETFNKIYYSSFCTDNKGCN